MKATPKHHAQEKKMHEKKGNEIDIETLKTFTKHKALSLHNSNQFCSCESTTMCVSIGTKAVGTLFSLNVLSQTALCLKKNDSKYSLINPP